MIGADTSFLVDFLRGDKNAVSWMEKHYDTLHLCEHVVYEFLCGNLGENERDVFLGFVSQFPVFGFDRNAALKSSELYRHAKQQGKTVAHPDVMVAGIYAANNVKKIITRNKTHFKNIHGISVTSY